MVVILIIYLICDLIALKDKVVLDFGSPLALKSLIRHVSSSHLNLSISSLNDWNVMEIIKIIFNLPVLDNTSSYEPSSYLSDEQQSSKKHWHNLNIWALIQSNKPHKSALTFPSKFISITKIRTEILSPARVKSNSVSRTYDFENKLKLNGSTIEDTNAINLLF